MWRSIGTKLLLISAMLIPLGLAAQTQVNLQTQVKGILPPVNGGVGTVPTAAGQVAVSVSATSIDYLTLPTTCPLDGGHALNYTPGGGFVCQTISGTGGGITGSGTSGYLPLWTGANTVGNSLLDYGVTTANSFTFGGASNVGFNVKGTSITLSSTNSSSLTSSSALSLQDTNLGSWYSQGGLTLSNTDNVTGLQLNQTGTAPLALNAVDAVNVTAGTSLNITTSSAANFLANGSQVCTLATGCDISPPGGTAGAMQYYLTSSSLGGLNGTGFPYLNGSSAPSVATSAQIAAALSATPSPVSVSTLTATTSVTTPQLYGTGDVYSAYSATKLPRVNVVHPDFGVPSGCANAADPTGVNDSTCAIQAALAFLEANYQGLGAPVLYFPAGTYKISAALRIPNFVKITGDGKTSTIIKQTCDTCNVLTIVNGNDPNPNVWTSEGGIYNLETFTPDGHLYTATEIEIQNSSGYHIEHVTVSNGGGRGIVTAGSTERGSFYDITVNTVRWPILAMGNEERWRSINLNSPGEDSSGYCYGTNCINGVYPNDQWNVGTLEYASANGTTGTAYIHGTYHNSTPDGTAPINAGNYFQISGTTGTVLDGQYQSTSITNGITSDPSGLCTSANPCFEVQWATTANGVATVTGATWLPAIAPDNWNQGAFFMSGAAVELDGCSIKANWFMPAVSKSSTFGSTVKNCYFEGFPIYGQPHTDASLVAGGNPVYTSATGAMTGSSAPWTIAVASTEWFPNYINDPSDANTVSGGEYAIEPQDFISGSSAPSAYVPGVNKGQFEVVLGNFASDGQLHITARNQAGSTAPANTAWPSGSIVVVDPQPSYGTFELANDHLESIDPTGTNWAAYCSDSGLNICGEVIVGNVLNQYSPVAAEAQDVDTRDDEWWGACSTTATEPLGQGCIKVLAGAVSGNFPANETGTTDTGIGYNLGVSNAILVNAGSSASHPGKYYANTGTGQQISLIDPPTGSDPVVGENPGSGIPNAKPPFGEEYQNSYCWYDTPPSGQTHSLTRFCLSGGPNNTNGNAGIEADSWNTATSQWQYTLQLQQYGGYPFLKFYGSNGNYGIESAVQSGASATDTFNSGSYIGQQMDFWNGTSSAIYLCGVTKPSSNTGSTVVPTLMYLNTGCYSISNTNTVIPLATDKISNVAAGSTRDFSQYTNFKMPAGATVANKSICLADGTNCAAAAVSSVFGRTGAVVAASGDYSVGQVTGAAPLASPAFTGSITQNATRSGTYNLMQSGAVSGLLSGDNVYSQLGDTAAYVNDDFQWGFNYTADGSSSNYGWFGLPGDPYCTISTAGLLSCPAFSATTSMTTPVEFFVYNGSEVSSIQATSATNTQYTGTGTNTFAGSISAGGSIVSGAGIGPSPSALWTYGTAAPSGSCNSGSLYSNTAGSSGSTFYVCVSGAWTAQPLPDFIVSISSGTQNAHSCSTPGSVNIPGVTTTMALLPGYTSDPASLVGWGASGGMVFHIWPSAANTVQYEVCNQTAANITYSAISFNVAAR